MHISLCLLCFIKTVELLCFRKWSKCCHCADLCLSSCEHSRTMNSRDQVYFCCKRSDLIDRTTIRTLMIFEDHLSYCLLLILVNSLTKLRKILFVVCKCFLESLCDHTDILFSCLLVICKYSLFHLSSRNDLLDRIKEFLRNSKALILMFRLSTLCNDRVKESNHFLVQIMCCKDSFDHLRFRNFFRTGLDHDNLFLCRSNCQCKLGNFLLCCCRVEYELSVNESNLCCRDRSVKRNIRNTCCKCSTEHSCKFRAAVLIYRKNKILKCYVISIIFREQRTHRTVDDTVCQDRILRCFTLSLIKSSRDLSYSVHSLIILYAEWEEINSFSRLVRCCCCTQYSCVTIMHQHCTIRLFCHTVNIHAQCSAGQFHFKLFIHGFLLFILSSFYMSRTIRSETTEKCTIP